MIRLAKPKNMSFNDKLAIEVFSLFDAEWQKRGYREENSPHKKLPRLDTAEEQANLLLFYTMANLNRSSAESATSTFISLMDERAEIIDPQEVILMEPELVQGLVAGKFNANRHIASSWWHNAKTLVEQFGGSALNIITDSDCCFETIWAKLQLLTKQGVGLKTIRIKGLCLFLSLMQEAKLIEKFPIPLTLDFHVLRILWAFEIANFSEYARPLVPTLPGQEELRGIESVKTWQTHMEQCAFWSLGIFEQTGLDPVWVNRYIWELSRLDCKECPERCAACKYREYCKYVVSSTTFYRYSGLLTRESRENK